MAETDAIVGIFGAVDRAVQDDPIARLRVSQLLPQYQDPKFHWYDDFQKWLGETAEPGDVEPVFPGLGDALDQLAEKELPEGRVLARRMFAVAIATRAFPQMEDPESRLRRSAIAALRASPEDDSEPEDLYRLLAGEDRPAYPDNAEIPGAGGWWEGVVLTAVGKNALPDTVGMYPRPCSGRLVTVPGIDGPAAAFRTEHVTDKISFERATRFIEPVNWKTCMPSFWCNVDLIADPKLLDGQRRYREVVSTHCREKSRPGFWAETELLFYFMWLPGKHHAEAAVANYELAEGRPLENDRIRVDEGTLVVAKMEDGRSLLVTTTKRIKFSYPFSSQALALIMCALGYADVAGVLLACAASKGKPPEGVDTDGTDFPGVAPTHAPARPGGGDAVPAASAGSAGQPGPGGLIQDWVDIWAQAMRDGARALERGAGGTGSKPKKPDRPGG